MDYQSVFTPNKPNLNGILEFSVQRFDAGDAYNVYVVDSTWSTPQHACMDITHAGAVYSLGFSGESGNMLALRSPDPQLPRSIEQTVQKKSVKLIESLVLNESQAGRLNALIQPFNRGARFGNTFPIKYYAVNGATYGYFGNNCITILSQLFPIINRHLTCSARIVTNWANPTIRAGKRRKRKSRRRLKIII